MRQSNYKYARRAYTHINTQNTFFFKFSPIDRDLKAMYGGDFMDYVYMDTYAFGGA